MQRRQTYANSVIATVKYVPVTFVQPFDATSLVIQQVVCLHHTGPCCSAMPTIMRHKEVRNIRWYASTTPRCAVRPVAARRQRRTVNATRYVAVDITCRCRVVCCRAMTPPVPLYHAVRHTTYRVMLRFVEEPNSAAPRHAGTAKRLLLFRYHPAVVISKMSLPTNKTTVA